jgi:hypothetical protein
MRRMDDLGRVVFVLTVLRRERVPFGDAWSIAFPSSKPDRDRCDLRLALSETRQAWERAYVGEPAERAEVTALLLLGMLTERDGADDRGELVGARLG